MSSPAAPPAVRFSVRRPCADGECPVSDGRCDCSDPVYLVDVDELLEDELLDFCNHGTRAQRAELVEYFAGRRRRVRPLRRGAPRHVGRGAPRVATRSAAW